MDLQTLIDMPGAGNAVRDLKANGYWREDYTFDDAVERLSYMNVTATLDAKLVISYSAKNEWDIEEKLRKAMEAVVCD